MPDSGKGRLQRIVLALLREHEGTDNGLPTNPRFVFYELEFRGVVRKSRKGESRRGTADDPREQEVTDATIWLRVHGVVPWSWIEDETRTLYAWGHARTVADYLRREVDYARVNPWPGEPPLLLVESRSLGGVLRAVTERYVCPIAATNGQVGGFLYTEVAPILADNDRAVLYLGDWDHQGHQIEENTRRVLERETGREIAWTRVAITKEQIAKRHLTPIWKTDNRYKPPQETEAWEAEALGQQTIVRLVRKKLDSLLPEPLADVLEREAVERVRMRAVLQRAGRKR
ncbi:MAG: hypothetical protein M3O91_01480 [Chloroflexota bacterium]|nr:hypothetical protein [Chloroflexota bacterium]